MPEGKTYSLEEAYEATGGFGLFQVFSSAILIMGFITGSFLTFAMSFLELYPRYLCKNAETGTEYECKPNQFCGTNIQYRIDFDYFTSLHNWVEDLDLTCTPKS